MPRRGRRGKSLYLAYNRFSRLNQALFEKEGEKTPHQAELIFCWQMELRLIGSSVTLASGCRPRLMPMDSAVWINCESDGTWRTIPARLLSGTRTISRACNATMFPNFPSAAASTARITALRPEQSSPPVRIPTRLRLKGKCRL